MEEENQYKDEKGLIWLLQPHEKNMLHQPKQAPNKPKKSYPNVHPPLIFDAENSNLKFLSITESGGSYEAILQPNGEYLLEGAKQGTCNYVHPAGLLGWGY